MYGDVFNNFDWSCIFQTWSRELKCCESEEDLYIMLKKFKEEFNSSYGKLSRRKRRKDGFRYKEGK